MSNFFCSFPDILLISDGSLYAGVHVDFMATDPAIFMTMGSRPAIRTEQYDSRWINGKDLVKLVSLD